MYNLYIRLDLYGTQEDLMADFSKRMWLGHGSVFNDFENKDIQVARSRTASLDYLLSIKW